MRGVPPRAGLRERGKAERRVRVVEAAIELLRHDGIDALSMRALSVEAGVSVPTIYNLIGGRDAVLAAVLDQLGTVFAARVATLGGDSALRVLDIADCLVDTIADHATLARSIIAEGLAPMLAESDTALLRRYGLTLHAALVDASAGEHLAAVTGPELLVDQMVSLTAVRIFRWADADAGRDPDGEQLRAAVVHGVGLLLAAVAVGPTRDRALARVAGAGHQLHEEAL